jgi:MarR family transcriptional regulator, 2-MHQ and catechol-resistance regulon repressor
MTDINLKLVIAIARCHNSLFEKIDKNTQSFGLNTSEFGVLELLFHKGPQPVQKVAEKILVTSGTITYVIDKLQKKQLVERKKCEKDKRIFYVILTEEGKTLMENIFEQHKLFVQNVFEGFDEKSKEELVSHLFHLYNLMNIDSSST